MSVGELQVVFFVHNLHHEDVFSKVAEKMKLIDSEILVSFLVSDESESIEGRVNVYRDALTLKKNGVNFRFEEERIKRIYPNFNIEKAILSDRDSSLVPSFFHSKKMDYENIKQEMIAFFIFFENYFDKNRVNFIFSELIIGMCDAVCYEVARERKVQYISMRSARMLKGFIFSDPYSELPIDFNLDKSEAAYNKSEKIHESVGKYILNQKDLDIQSDAPHYMIRTSRSIKLVNAEYFKKFFRYIFDRRIKIFRPRFSKNSIYLRVKHRIIRYKNAILVRHFYRQYFSGNIRWTNRKYLLFPLQYQPEATSGVRSFPFIDQIALIKSISFSLPDGVYLYVKEHKGNEGYRDIKDYRELYYLGVIRTRILCWANVLEW